MFSLYIQQQCIFILLQIKLVVSTIDNSDIKSISQFNQSMLIKNFHPSLHSVPHKVQMDYFSRRNIKNMFLRSAQGIEINGLRKKNSLVYATQCCHMLFYISTYQSPIIHSLSCGGGRSKNQLQEKYGKSFNLKAGLKSKGLKKRESQIRT